MLYIEGKDYKQIAEELGLFTSTIRNQKAKGVQLLKKWGWASGCGVGWLNTKTATLRNTCKVVKPCFKVLAPHASVVSVLQLYYHCKAYSGFIF